MMIITKESYSKLKSKVWRMTHLYKIKNKEGELVTFKLNAAQKKYLLWKQNHRYNYIIKPRQKGFTTLHCIDLLDKALWIPGSSCAILAHKQDAVIKIFEIVKRAYDNIPLSIRPQSRYDNRNELQFVQDFTGRKLDSSIYVALKLRSGTVTDLHISESAYIDDRQELNAGSKQAVGKTGRITEETTGNGYNQFYDEVIEALNDTTTSEEYRKKVFFYSWFDDDEYELDTEPLTDLTEEEKELKEKYSLNDRKIAWRRWKMKELGSSSLVSLGLNQRQLFKQEYPATLMEAFQASGNTLFDQEKVENIKTKQPELITDYGLKIWYQPIEGHKYVVGVDPSTGKGIDSASVNVWDVTRSEPKFVQVAQWHGYTDPYTLAEITQRVSEKYNRALASVENNQLTTVLVLSKTYDNIYYTIRKDKQTEQITQILGFSTNTKTRPVMIDNFNKLFNEDLLEINSEITKSEMRTFIIKENKKIEHADGKHDDSLFGDFIALETRDSATEIEFFEAIA